ncbi:hypothetical protein BJV85_000041 [Clostridium acetobutylicum]|uniref:Predicted membrane protein n=1 Tax=Clostridium acetobutylicum (strain ATCC 824 / DSM 792 / JCM 1419 / IAM 19013 / LMG 5710 / NBRC 13948 / NRRL B-527 / VKM B-1787 / 2291 / W) TaxID=272562 RepID=Q97MS7_CLOAB|nr:MULTISPECIES: metal-dependent hydrolase [Clostridium]AAK78099.1 Predicted membrane protein [Clostridium acetobutylicum ATCC 824]ADZ19158.1 Membrane protein [Clostridium acetobutylicum EA 2018]AEI31065.1 hypothetical protein SMB_G0115 [Clostridium acetobutylicum DSM 1731]AWV81839.1 metal-dependent hydrolase [Clostridium acetobutylicum]MBC2395386.1 metal-dependent hydrolase [Clostridium acetobutylicum]
MIFFGHLGLTTGAVKICENTVLSKKKDIDYRFLLVGSILPDLIDKPIGAFFFRNVFHNSRIFGHTLLFSAVLLCIGLYRQLRHKKNGILMLGIGSAIHLILDSMWLYGRILFWPFLGATFPTRPEGHWLNEGILRLLSDPVYFSSEIIGFVIIMYYFIKLIKRGKLRNFIKNGQL